MRPRKLRLLVLTHRSPAARTPMWPPQQGPQVGRAHGAARIHEDLDDPLLQSLLVDGRGGGNHDAADVRMHLSSPSGDSRRS